MNLAPPHALKKRTPSSSETEISTIAGTENTGDFAQRPLADIDARTISFFSRRPLCASEDVNCMTAAPVSKKGPPVTRTEAVSPTTPFFGMTSESTGGLYTAKRQLGDGVV